jgi:hypothetical protein
MRLTATTTPRFTHRVAAGCALLAAALAPASAHAAPASDALCTSVFTAQISPGFSARPGSGAVTSGGETGTLVCTGRVNGRRITGVGTFSVEETYTTGAACVSDKSRGQVAMTIPTTGGAIHIVGALTARRIGLVELVDIAFPGARFKGTGVVVPTRGNCFLAPLTRAAVSVTGTLRG